MTKPESLSRVESWSRISLASSDIATLRARVAELERENETLQLHNGSVPQTMYDLLRDDFNTAAAGEALALEELGSRKDYTRKWAEENMRLAAEVRRLRAQVKGIQGEVETCDQELADLCKRWSGENSQLRTEMGCMVQALQDEENEHKKDVVGLEEKLVSVQEDAMQACVTPVDDCECAGCSYAADVNARRLQGEEE